MTTTISSDRFIYSKTIQPIVSKLRTILNVDQYFDLINAKSINELPDELKFAVNYLLKKSGLGEMESESSRYGPPKAIISNEDVPI